MLTCLILVLRLPKLEESTLDKNPKIQSHFGHFGKFDSFGEMRKLIRRSKLTAKGAIGTNSYQFVSAIF